MTTKDDELTDRAIATRLKPTDAAEVERVAEAEGLSVSAVVRRAILRDVRQRTREVAA
jgi:hypothetical protein